MNQENNENELSNNIIDIDVSSIDIKTEENNKYLIKEELNQEKTDNKMTELDDQIEVKNSYKGVLIIILVFVVAIIALPYIEDYIESKKPKEEVVSPVEITENNNDRKKAIEEKINEQDNSISENTDENLDNNTENSVQPVE